MNKFVGKFMFHPVGHGLFYSGIIKKCYDNNQFSFVYDCGGKDPKTINASIEDAKLPPKIDLLIISHFHADHINGVLKLTEEHQIETVVLPYLDYTSKILYITKLKEEKNENEAELTEFIQDPQDFLKRYDVKEVFFIKEGEDYHPPKRNDENQEGRGNNDENFKSFSWNCEIIEDNDKKIIVGNGNYFSPIWVFNFFMPKIGEKKFEEINNALEKKGFIDEKTKKVNLESIDEATWKKINEIKSLRKNAFNLVCAHGPTENVSIQTICNNKFIPSELFNHCWEYDCLFYHHYRRCHKKNIGFQFLTGDAEIDNKDAFIENYRSDLRKSILFQVPHHGSKENWKDWFSEYQPFCNLWPVTHNLDHKYGLPSATFSYIAPYSVTEYEPTRLGIQIHFISKI
jgi:hypothetical protein